MQLSTLDNVLWAVAFLGNAALLLVMLWRRRARDFPYFFSWIAFGVFDTACLFLIYRFSSQSVYAWVYWLSAFIDISIQVVVVFELANHVFRSPDSTSESMRSLVRKVGIVATLVAFGLACGVHPSAPRSLDAWEVRGNLFASLLICELFTVVIVLSQKFGFGWRSHAVGLGAGLTLWAIVSLSVDLLHGYWGAVLHFKELEHVRMFSNLAAIAFWLVTLWRDEPKRKPISPEMRDTLLHLTDKVSYDLAKALGTRGKEFR